MRVRRCTLAVAGIAFVVAGTLAAAQRERQRPAPRGAESWADLLREARGARDKLISRVRTSVRLGRALLAEVLEGGGRGGTGRPAVSA